MKTGETWKYIHQERAVMADTLEGLSAEQWATPSACQGWTVQLLAGHILAAAEQTRGRFFKGLASAGFKFDVLMDRDAHRNAALGTTQLVARLRARTTTTNHPPGPQMAMLGEIVIHGEDLRGPLGLQHQSPQEAVVAVADFYKGSNLIVGAKRRIAGLRLVATDSTWRHGEGPEVSGPIISLLLAMTGRPAGLSALSGEGVATLAARDAQTGHGAAAADAA
jgi:uncharacterized protein (TIGR03083 family)